ncbi:hypothetical protein BHE90_004422 [Fusarium euwallaceae]|uniref:Uncharacterized protein n=1 Tax=Fusarium euwallaceae TaxID=1147111 RepID=A0A430LZA2_9HYPO|nr:hypothetical protein BHE90_004422 [Fusarium euwallaceae]
MAIGTETIKKVDFMAGPGNAFNLPTSKLAGTSWRDYGEVILVDNINEAYKLADEFSSEHAQILTQNPRVELEKDVKR